MRQFVVIADHHHRCWRIDHSLDHSPDHSPDLDFYDLGVGYHLDNFGR